jgi:hypothetical protein
MSTTGPTTQYISYSEQTTQNITVVVKIAGLDLKDLRKQVDLLEGRVQKLVDRRNRLFPPGPAILVDTAANQIYMVQGSKVLVQDKCSTGSGLELTDAGGHRTWTFDTPRGYFRVLSKTSNPVWYRPDWAFIEEGTPIPRDPASRAMPDVLGAYAIAFGDGYFLHGTLRCFVGSGIGPLISTPVRSAIILI